MSDYPEELDTEDITELASYIERRYPTELLRMHDTRTIHFAYWDVSHRSVCAEFLDHIQQAGYKILYAGVATCPRTATRRAWVECQKRELVEQTAENNEFTLAADGAYVGAITESDDQFTLTCPNCNDKFTPSDAKAITIPGPDEAHYVCPQCGHGTNGPPPMFDSEE